MKYTRLPLQDLQDLEKEFIDFLAINGIPADDWERMKKNDLDKVEGIIDQFSDVVWEGLLRKTEMVELRRKDTLTVCRVEEGDLTTLVVKAANENIDLTKSEDIEKVLSDIDHIEINVRKDEITKPATEQLFELIQVGFYVSKNPKYIDIIKSSSK
ncbi:DUF6495 family protein [Brumimicrobium mesophilum]|uniref:DUF6495 family protein n=1 Tax=Brumimicrobium mesophilum TaxID=392717 RepID=UPI000D1445A3|nr:DUF6495 family protein [Brumimicrobium mesophilum]